MHLLDVNVLIALSDARHEHHQRCRAWFFSEKREAWATCPLTENGFVRILGQTSYPNFSGSAQDAREVFDVLVRQAGHQFWPDDISIRDRSFFPIVVNSRELTDLYLLGLAVSRQGRFATLDARVDPERVPGGSRAYYLIP